MTREKFDEMSFEDILEYVEENSLIDITTEDVLLEFVKTKIDDDNIPMALHILNAVYNNHYDTEHYQYDYCMGMLETPTPITDKEDLEEFLDFDEE